MNAWDGIRIHIRKMLGSPHCSKLKALPPKKPVQVFIFSIDFLPKIRIMYACSQPTRNSSESTRHLFHPRSSTIILFSCLLVPFSGNISGSLSYHSPLSTPSYSPTPHLNHRF